PKQRLAERQRGVLIGAVHPGGPPGHFRGLDDERRTLGLVLIRVDAPEAVTIALEIEGERGEGAGGAEPHVAVGAPIDGRLEPVEVTTVPLKWTSMSSQ